MITLKHGTDYTKIPLSLRTKSGKIHPYDSDLAPKDMDFSKTIIVDQQWDPNGYSVTNVNDQYLSLKNYNSYFSRGCASYNRVEEFKTSRAAKQNYLGTAHLGSLYRDAGEVVAYDDLEVRFYRDGSCIFLYQIDDKIFTFHDMGNWGWWTGHSIRRGEPMSPQFLAKIKMISSDEEARNAAQFPTQKLIGTLLRGFRDLTATDLRNGHIYGDTLAERNPYFTDDTATIVNNFFDVNGWRNADALNKYKKIADHYSIRTSVLPDKPIRCIKALFSWSAAHYRVDTHPTVEKALAKKEERAQHFAELFKTEWNDTDSEKYKYDRFWAREGDDIVLAKPSVGNGRSYYWASSGKAIFAFNVKTRKRFYAEYNGGCWTFPIPSLKLIQAHMGLNDIEGSSRTAGAPKDVQHINTHIKDGLTVKQLFAKTNIEWIIDNGSKDLSTYARNFNNSWCYSIANEYRPPVSVIKELTNPNINSLALSILISTGIPAMEQLLKSKLFNLYFAYLEDQETNREDSFYDLSKKRATSYSEKYACLSFNGKAKNLKAMTGLSMNSLRIIDSLAPLKESSGRGGRWSRPMPRLAGAEKVFGQSLSSLDAKTFERIIAISSRELSGSSIWSELGDIFTQALGDNPSAKQIMDLLEAYYEAPSKPYYSPMSGLQNYRDYLRSRESLKRVQANLIAAGAPEIVTKDIFTEKRYPIKPWKAKRFLPFVTDMRDRRYIYSARRISNEGEFTRMITDQYRSANDRGDVSLHYAKNDEGKVIMTGALINMTPAENVKFLHDDASYWASFYQDKAKDKLFVEAVKRVQPLEWSDPKSGLQIIAPTTVSDLKQEGKTLCHCVGSYVDAIIDGTDNIMFLRRTDMPNDPFFTVELVRDGEIRQVHCYQNGDLTEDGIRRAYTNSGYEVYNKMFDIPGFLRKWATAMKGKVDASTIKPRYGAYGALRR